MKKEIVVNAEDLESRVAILEQGKLAELQVEREARMVGSIYKARVVSVLPGMDAAFADVGLERNVFLCADDVGFVSRDGVSVSRAPRSAGIAQRLKQNQEVVVQIVRAPVGGKGARATTRLALPGRYLVLLLAHAAQVGISRKIEEPKERDRLRKIGQSIRPKEMGIIVRTEAEGHNRKEIESDLKVLLDLHERLTEDAAKKKAPALLHQDLTLSYQVIRDVFSEDVQRLVIDEKGVYDTAVDLVKRFAPKLRRRVKLYRGRMPIFHEYGIEGEIDRLLRRKVWLDVGGYISIDQAEAFTAIDVNTGRYTGSKGLEDTILRTNLEAAEEIARQLRLRDLGGIIVIDFIDMERKRNRDRVVKAFEAALRRDRQRTKILHLSPLGLIEMTRKRRGESLMGILTDACPHCAGLGRIRNALTIALKLQREVCRLAAEEKTKALVLRAPAAVASILVGDRGERAAELEKRANAAVYIRADHRLGLEEHEVLPTTRKDAQQGVSGFSKNQEVALDRVDPPEPGDEEVCGWVDGYRVCVEKTTDVSDGTTVVLDQADRSFGRARVKGAKKAGGEDQKTKPGQEKKAAKKKRRRPRRKRKPKAAAKTPEAEPDAEQKTQAAESAAPEASPPEQTAQAEAERTEEQKEEPAKRKRGLLSRGARRIARTRR